MPKSLSIRLDLRDDADYRMNMKKKKQVVVQGDNAVYTIEPEELGGFTGDVDLTITGLPENATGELSSETLAYDETATATIGTTSVAVGEHSFYINSVSSDAGDYDWLTVDNASRLYDWPTYCGIPGGIPNRTTIYTSLGTAGQSPSYEQEVTATQIAAAVAACPSDQVVYLYPGTYNIGNWSWVRKSGVTVRGAGPGQTNLRPNTGGSFISTGYPDFTNPINISSGYTQGSMSITLASSPSAGFAAGNLVVIAETTDYPDKWGEDIGIYRGENCTGMYFWNANSDNRKFAYCTRIVSVVGNTINLASPIPLAFSVSQSPQAWPQDSSAAPCSMCGLEEMTLDGAATGSSYAAINYRSADRMWLKNVEIKNFSGGDNGIVASYTCFQNEFRRVYLHDCQGFPTQGDGQGFAPTYSDSNMLIVDCIVRRVASLIQMAGSNVEAVLYNYTGQLSRGPYDANNWINAACASHAPESIMGLYEGNVIASWQHDGYHGSSAWQTLYRNHINGVDGLGNTELRKLVQLLWGSYYINVIGNVLGDSSWTMLGYDGSSGTPDSVAYVLGTVSVWGYGSTPDVDWPNYSGPIPDTNVAATLLRHANYDYYNHAVVWTGDLGHSLPNSLFYDSKPSWFGSLDWPAIGPDVGGYVTDIPAQRRWETYLVSGDLDDLFTDVS